MVSPILSPKRFRSRNSKKKRLILITILALIIQAGCKNESGITELSNIPKIRSTNPSAAAVDIAVNTSIIAIFNDEMDPSTLTDSSFLLRLDTVSVPGTISYTDSTATFVPLNDLEFENTYTATITADVQNMDGDALDSNYEWEFTTTSKTEETDDTPPQINSTTPANEKENVSINTAVIATFNEPMNGSTINATTFSLEQGSTPISGNVTYSESRATFSPSSPLDFDKTYTATVTTNAEDTAGNALAEDYSWSFTTGDQPDNTPPQITGTDPTDNEQDVSVSSSVTVVFNEVINATSIGNSTFRLERGGTQVSGTYDVSENSATFTPSDDLSFESSYTATVTTGVEDLEGNNLESNFSWDFTTTDEPDNTPPEVGSMNPADDEQNVSIDTDISATFSEPLDASTVNDSNFFIEQGNSTISGSLSLSGSTITFTPSSDLNYESTYTVTVTTGIRDLADNNLEDSFSWDFTTADEPDDTGPQVTGTEPSDGAEDISIETEISATFSEPISASDPDDAFVVEQGGSSIPGSVDISSSTITFTPASDLDYERTYTATVTTAIEDSEGNNLDNDFSWSFTTSNEPDNIPPRITATDPGDGAEDVSIDAGITVTFSEPLNTSTVTSETFSLRQGDSRISGSLSSSGNTIVLTPADDLDFETTYSVRVTTGIEDASGNSLEDDTEWTFTTEEEPDTAPEVNSTNPDDGATNVSVKIDEITVTFSKDMNADTFDEDSFILTQDGDEVDGDIPGFEGATASFIPDDDLEYDATYTVNISSEVEDLAGNNLDEDFESSFITEGNPDDDDEDDEDDNDDNDD